MASPVVKHLLLSSAAPGRLKWAALRWQVVHLPCRVSRRGRVVSEAVLHETDLYTSVELDISSKGGCRAPAR